MGDLTLQQLVWIVGVVLAFAACGWAWDVARQAGLSPWAAISRYIAVQIVKDYQEDYAADPHVMSRESDQTAQTDQTDRQTDEPSAADRWMDRLEVDKTKTALIELLVYSGWGVGEIRSILKGDSGVLGTEIDAARKRLGIAATAAYVTPVAGRPADPRLFQTDPEFPYQAPA